ncbi:progesterone receptor-like [Mus pahari]|uniref:progesterone receptor-like n=1 Tax=Mus pahari TaxID=10093 RepID=UPI0011150262|nr:progesterone receptor-like [Mus pahari]
MTKQAQGEPSWRGQDPAQGLGVVPAEGNQGAFKVAPAAALLRRPDLALAAAGALAAAAAAAATAHLASRARTLGAPPPGRPRQSAERPARWQRCQGRRWCWREGGERVAPRAGGECYVGRRAPRPRAGRTRRRGGAREERGAGARVSPPPRRATAQGGGGAGAAARLLCPRRVGTQGPGWVEVGGWGIVSALVPSLSVPHSPSGATAGGPQLAWADRPRIKLAGPRGHRGDNAQSQAHALWPGAAASRATLRVCYGVAEAARLAGTGGGWVERRPSGVGLPAVSHGPLQQPRPCRPPAPARSGQGPPGATAEPGKSPGGMLRDPGSLSGRKEESGTKARRRNPAFRQGSYLPGGKIDQEEQLVLPSAALRFRPPSKFLLSSLQSIYHLTLDSSSSLPSPDASPPQPPPLLPES